MEEEVCEILRDAIKEEGRERRGFSTAVSELFRGIGLKEGEELPELRGFTMEVPDFEDLAIPYANPK